MRKLEAWCRVKGNDCIKENIVSGKKKRQLCKSHDVSVGRLPFVEMAICFLVWEYGSLIMKEIPLHRLGGFGNARQRNGKGSWGGCAGCWNATELQRKQLPKNMAELLFPVISHASFRASISFHQCVYFVVTSWLGSVKTGCLVCVGFSLTSGALSKCPVLHKYMQYLDPHASANMEI